MMEATEEIRPEPRTRLGLLEIVGGILAAPYHVFESERLDPRPGPAILIVFLAGFGAGLETLLVSENTPGTIPRGMMIMLPFILPFASWFMFGIFFGLVSMYSYFLGARGRWLPLFTVTCYAHMPLVLFSLLRFIFGKLQYGDIVNRFIPCADILYWLEPNKFAGHFSKWLTVDNLWMMFLIFAGVKVVFGFSKAKALQVVLYTVLTVGGVSLVMYGLGTMMERMM